MQAMYSSNLSRIRNITSFPKRRALMPRGYPVNWLLLRQAQLPLSSLSWPRVNPPPCSPACGRVPAAAREEVTQPSGKWEGRPERGPCAQPAPPQHIRTRPILCGHLSPAGLQCGQHRQGPKDPLLTAGLVSAVRLPCPLGGQSHIQGDYVIRDVPLGPTASRKSPLGSSVASMGAGGRESGGKRLLGRRICSRVTLGERAPSLCTQRWTRAPLGPLGEKDIRRGDQSLQTGQRASPAPL